MNSSASPFSAFDLTRRAPRSLRCRLGGFAVLPRTLDKCRALIAGQIGEYHFDCPLDRQFFDFTGIDAAAFKAELAHGRTDTDMLAWVRKHATHARAPWEIEKWSDYQERRPPGSDPDTSAFFNQLAQSLSPQRADLLAWADLLDLDDHVSFGGTA